MSEGAVVAIDPRTGGVVAMVSTPSFDANLFVGGISTKDYGRLQDSQDLPLFNRALQGQYPPASTVKPFYGLAGLHYGVITPQSKVADPVGINYPTTIICTETGPGKRKKRPWRLRRSGAVHR